MLSGALFPGGGGGDPPVHSLPMTTPAALVVGAELDRVTAECVAVNGLVPVGAAETDTGDAVELNMCAAVCFCRVVTIWLLRTAITQGYVMCGWSDSLREVMLVVVVLVMVDTWLCVC